MKRLISYLEARLSEQSTWTGIGVAIAGAAVLPAPYSYMAIGVGVVAMLVPNRGGTSDKQRNT